MALKILRNIVIVLVVLAAIVAAVYAFFVSRSQPMPEHPLFASDEVLVIAHQGGDGERPSNTLAAFQYAVELGADMLEMDIHSTSDGVLVVIHDDTVDRTTDGSGRVQDFTFAELQTLDAGYDWPTLEDSPVEGNPYRGQGITIPALEEVFTAFPTFPMVIEIKQAAPPIVEPFCAMLRQYERADLTIVASFDADTMYAFRETCPEVPTSAAEPEVRLLYALNLFRVGAAYQPTAHAFQVPEYSGDLHVLTPDFVQVAQQHNIEVQAWTINDPDDMLRMIDLGVDGIITDYPGLLMTTMGRI